MCVFLLMKIRSNTVLCYLIRSHLFIHILKYMKQENYIKINLLCSDALFMIASKRSGRFSIPRLKNSGGLKKYIYSILKSSFFSFFRLLLFPVHITLIPENTFFPHHISLTSKTNYKTLSLPFVTLLIFPHKLYFPSNNLTVKTTACLC